MKNLKQKNTLIIASIFILIYIGGYFLLNLLKDEQVKTLLDYEVKSLKLNYDITVYYNKIDANAIYQNIQQNKQIIKIISQAQHANQSRRNHLRNKLYKILESRFKIMHKSKGIKMLMFSFPDNINFLRMHMPNNFGDNLGKIRPSVVKVNKNKKLMRGFEMGKFAHSLRNIYPLWGLKGEYLGCVDIAHSFDKEQETLGTINKIHTHFLVKKKLLQGKTWKGEILKKKYIPSIENQKYMINLTSEIRHNRLARSERYMLQDLPLIQKNMDESKRFAIHVKMENEAIAITFIPILSIIYNEPDAYLVSYKPSQEILKAINRNIQQKLILAIFLIIIFCLSYRRSLQKPL